ncbi:MAG: TonB-dependent receptor, partial [Phormidesmis sp. CAN_BIN44]|nr:TonB-dependent receptor [Phormidesmis sp. CAN_BIN44]
MNMKSRHFLAACLLGLGLIAESISFALLMPIGSAMAAATETATVLIVQSVSQAQPTVKSESQPAVRPDVKPSPTELSQGITLVSPIPKAVIDVPATTVVLRFPLDSQVELQVNGKSVSASLVGRTEKDRAKMQTTQTWYGVPLQDGDNTIVAQIISNGQVTQTASVQVQVRGLAKQITVRTAETRVRADGRSTVTVQGELLDANGNRSNRDTIVTLKPTAGEFVEPDANPDQPGYQVKASQGVFKATLRSGIQAQMVRIQAKADDLDAFTQVQFETDLRSSLVTGSIDFRLGKGGTDFYR